MAAYGKRLNEKKTVSLYEKRKPNTDEVP